MWRRVELTEGFVLCCAAGYHSIAQLYFAEKGFQHVALLTADGALEAAPAMGCADIILDLVSTGRGQVVDLKIKNACFHGPVGVDSMDEEHCIHGLT